MKQGDSHAANSGYEPGSFLKKRVGGDDLVQGKGNLRELGADSAAGRQEANPSGGVLETAPEPEDYGYVDRATIADLIRTEAEAIAKETKHGDLLKTIDKAAKAISSALAHDDTGDLKIADCIDAQTKALQACFESIAKCIDKNTAALEKIAKAEQREVHVEVREEKGAASLAAAIRLLVDSNRDVVAAMKEVVKAGAKEAPPTPVAAKPAGHQFEIHRGSNGEMLSVTATPLRAHPITGKVG